jgi:transposase InsO family protein
VKFALIDAEKATFAVAAMCAVLEVSRSGFYAWQKRKPSKRALDDQRLGVEAAEVYQRSRRRYGSPRVHAELKERGRRVGRKRIARLLRQQGLRARPTRHFKRTTLSDHKLPLAGNLLARRFDVHTPNEAWVSDITYVWTNEGWLYLVAILDLFSRRVVGWRTSETLHADFCRDALRSALLARQPAPGLIFHADRGSQFASDEVREILLAHEGVLSMSRRANCWDNAVAESFWSTIKAELVEVMSFPTRAQAETAIADYIDSFYNPVRRHSHLGYLSPVRFEQLATVHPCAA